MIDELEKYLLRKMLRQKVMGSKHISYNTILSGIPKHEIGDLKDAVNCLLKKGFLIWYDRGRGAIQINKDKLKEIKELVT
ncbi:hypothetical protein HY837_04735 [archaeon]|nr:hypothetical protein [archaeon]